MDLWKGPWNNQVFTSSFHLVLSEFLLEKEQEKHQESVSEPAKAMKTEKSDCLSHRVRCSLQKNYLAKAQ